LDKKLWTDVVHSIAFPLYSATSYGYTLYGSWEQAINACSDFIRENLCYEMSIVFGVRDDGILNDGVEILKGCKA